MAVAAGAIGGAVGSIASQGVGIAIGAQEEFNWKGVALGAIGGGVSGGLGAIASGSVGALSGLSGPGLGVTMARAAIGSALTQGIGVATGLQDKFSWKSVAASTVGAGVGAVAGDALGMNDPGFRDLGFGEQLGKRLLTGLAAGAATTAMRGGRISATQVAVDAFGNALGDSLAAANSSIPGPVGAAERASITGMFGDGSGSNSIAFRPDMSASTSDQLLADLGLGGRSYGGGALYADASSVMRTGIVSDAGGGVEDGGGYHYDRNYRTNDGGFGIEASKLPSDSQGTEHDGPLATGVVQDRVVGTPLPPSPYKWVSNEIVEGEVVSGHWADSVDTGDDSARLLARSKDSPAMQQWAKNYYSDGANSLNAAERADGFADNTNHSVRSDGSLLDMGRRLVQDIPLLVDVKNESAAPLRGYVNDMFALSNDPDAPFITRWAAQQSAASGINMLSEFESGFPTNTLGVTATVLGGGAIAKGINADIKVARAFGSLTEGELSALRYAGLSDAEIASHIAVNGDVYLFRGTSPGFAGNPGTQATSVSAAVDPYSATVFALEARAKNGEGVVHYGTRSEFGTFTDGNFPQAGAVREREVGLPISPTEFAQRAPNTIPVDMARQALREMGLPSLPYSVRVPSQRAQLLNDVPRMTPEQVADFLHRVGR